MRLFTVLTILFLFSQVTAQVVTKGEKTIINKTTGDTVITKEIFNFTSEDVTPRNSMIVVNPIKFLLFYNISYFQKVSESVVLGTGVQVPTVGAIDGIGFNAEVRFYPSGKNLRGFYFAPNLSYSSLELNEDNASANPFSIGALAGWQWFPSDEFAIGLGIGVDYYIGSINEDNDLNSYSGFVPALRFDIGYAW